MKKELSEEGLLAQYNNDPDSALLTRQKTEIVFVPTNEIQEVL